jgi:DNA-binding XRE family transcriptional regulator
MGVATQKPYPVRNITVTKYRLTPRQIKFKNFLAEKGMTQSDLAIRLGVHSSMLTHLVKGNCKSLGLQKAIVRIFKIPYEDLWEEIR